MAISPPCVVRTEGGPAPVGVLTYLRASWFMNIALWGENRHSGRSQPLDSGSGSVPSSLGSLGQVSFLYGTQFTPLKMTDLDLIPQGSSHCDLLQLTQEATFPLTCLCPSSNAFFDISSQDPWVTHPCPLCGRQCSM